MKLTKMKTSEKEDNYPLMVFGVVKSYNTSWRYLDLFTRNLPQKSSALFQMYMGEVTNSAPALTAGGGGGEWLMK